MGTSQTDKDVDPGRQSSGTGPECRSPAEVVLHVIMGQVEIPVGAVEHNDVEIRILLDEFSKTFLFVPETSETPRRGHTTALGSPKHRAAAYP
jgi:hypothetical protein